MNLKDRTAIIKDRINKALQPDTLTVIDDGAAHIGHSHEGAGHFIVKIVAQAFESKSLIERHRMVYNALDDLLKTDIHALKIDAKTPEEI